MVSAPPPGSFPGYGPNSGEPTDERPADETAPPPPSGPPAPQYQQFQPPAGAGDPSQPPPGYQPPAYQPAAYPPPAYQPPAYQAPGYPPQNYQQPAQPGYQPADYQPPAQTGYQPSAYAGAEPGATVPGGPPRHSVAPAGGEQSPYSQQWPPAYGTAATAPPQPAPGNLPYGGVPGMVLPANYPGYSSQTHRAVGVIGLVITAIGAALIVISFTALGWLSGDDGFGSTETIKFSDLHDLVTSDAPTVPRLYFNWLGWVLLAAAVVFAVLGNLPTRSHPAWRVLGVLVGLAGAVLTFYAIYNDGTTISDVFKYGSIGFWLAIAGFVVVAVGAIVGPRRVRN